MQPRTRRQREILNYITDFIENRGYEPSYQQIAKHFHLASKAGIAKHINALETQGLITRRRENGSFSLQLRSQNLSVGAEICEIEWLDLPKIADLQNEWENETLLISKFLIGYLSPDRIRAFLVPNDSMFDKQIREGDIALIEEKSFARDGETVVAVLEKKRAVLKIFYRDGANVELRPANDNYNSIRLAANKVEIRGIFRGLLRPLI